jgi:polar amino acid transport system ATP-binding protein
VIDNVTLAPVRAGGPGRAEGRERRRKPLARFGLDGREDDCPGPPLGRAAAAGGDRPCARHPPPAPPLDEVTGALDPELVGEVLELIRGLEADGMTMVIATHEMAFAREVADDVCFPHEGRVVERGAPARISTAPERPETQRFLPRVLPSGRL